MKLSRETRLNFLHYSCFVLPLAVVAVLFTVLAVGWYVQPDRLEIGYAPAQPIAYSHRLHAGTMQIPCLYCHSNALKSRQATIPTVAKCMNCHSVTKKDSPPIKAVAAKPHSCRDKIRVHMPKLMPNSAPPFEAPAYRAPRRPQDATPPEAARLSDLS